MLRRRKRQSELAELRKRISVADDGGLASEVAQAFSEEIVRLRGAMQEVLDVLVDSHASREFNEARARRILRDALKYEGWLRSVIDPGDAA